MPCLIPVGSAIVLDRDVDRRRGQRGCTRPSVVVPARRRSVARHTRVHKVGVLFFCFVFVCLQTNDGWRPMMKRAGIRRWVVVSGLGRKLISFFFPPRPVAPSRMAVPDRARHHPGWCHFICTSIAPLPSRAILRVPARLLNKRTFFSFWFGTAPPTHFVSHISE